MAKIYTRTGDDGSTGLIGGGRVAKSDARIDTFGGVDELNAAVGLATVVCDPDQAQRLRRVQNELFIVGSHLAAESGASRTTLPSLDPAIVTRLEQEIDDAETELPPLRNFILPGGAELAARLHVARTVCRRAERLAVALGGAAQVPPLIVTYLNRLSDWLFVQARLANQRAGVADVPWKPSAADA
jgi:cob(I)alamin adenosyltransferase